MFRRVEPKFSVRIAQDNAINVLIEAEVRNRSSGKIGERGNFFWTKFVPCDICDSNRVGRRGGWGGK